MIFQFFWERAHWIALNDLKCKNDLNDPWNVTNKHGMGLSLMMSFNAYKLILVCFYLTSQFNDIFSLLNPTLALDSNHYAMMLPWSVINIMLILIKKFLISVSSSICSSACLITCCSCYCYGKEIVWSVLVTFGPRKKVSVVFRCYEAPLYKGRSVRWSICRSVTPSLWRRKKVFRRTFCRVSGLVYLSFPSPPLTLRAQLFLLFPAWSIIASDAISHG